MGRFNVLTQEDLSFCKQFGKLLACKRKELKLSQQKVADKIGLSRHSIQMWESGKIRITLRNTFKLVDAGIISFESLNFGIKDR